MSKDDRQPRYKQRVVEAEESKEEKVEKFYDMMKAKFELYMAEKLWRMDVSKQIENFVRT